MKRVLDLIFWMRRAWRGRCGWRTTGLDRLGKDSANGSCECMRRSGKQMNWYIGCYSKVCNRDKTNVRLLNFLKCTQREKETRRTEGYTFEVNGSYDLIRVVHTKLCRGSVLVFAKSIQLFVLVFVSKLP